MTRRRDLVALLEEAGRAPVGRPASRRASRPGAGAPLLSLAETPPRAVVEARTAAPRVWPRRMAWGPVLALAALVVAVEGGFIARRASAPAVRVGLATDTSVVPAGGRPHAAAVGRAVPDGAVVQTGPHGHAAVGATLLGPGSVAVVTHNRIRVLVPTAASHHPEHRAATLSLRAGRAPRPGTGVDLRWSTYRGPGFAALLLLRSPAGARPSYPPASPTSVLAARLSPDEATAHDDPGPGRWTYEVVAIDAAGRELAHSPAVVVTVRPPTAPRPRPLPTTTSTSTTSTTPPGTTRTTTAATASSTGPPLTVATPSTTGAITTVAAR